MRFVDAGGPDRRSSECLCDMEPVRSYAALLAAFSPQIAAFVTRVEQVGTGLAMVEGENLITKGSWVSLEELEASDVDVRNLTSLTVTEASAIVRDKAKTLAPYIGTRKEVARL